jgi:hypothetical protein
LIGTYPILASAETPILPDEYGAAIDRLEYLLSIPSPISADLGPTQIWETESSLALAGHLMETAVAAPFGAGHRELRRGSVCHKGELTNQVHIEGSFLYPRLPVPNPSRWEREVFYIHAYPFPILRGGKDRRGRTQHRDSQPLTEARLPFTSPEGGSNAAFQDRALRESTGRARMR